MHQNHPSHRISALAQNLQISLEILKYLLLILHSGLSISEYFCHLSFCILEVLAFLYICLCSLHNPLPTEKMTSSSFPKAAVPAVQTARSALPGNPDILHLLSAVYPDRHK